MFARSYGTPVVAVVRNDSLPNFITYDFLNEYTNSRIIASNLSSRQVVQDEQSRARIV